MRSVHSSRLDLNLLVVLQRLFEAGSVTGAAARLGLSQPAVSRALGRLREAFGDPLFVRTRLGLSPSPRAEQLKAELLAVLGRVEALVSGGTSFEPARATRTFSVGASDYAQAVVLPRLLAALARAAPGLMVKVLPVEPGWAAALADGRWDLMWAPRRRGAAGLVWTHLFQEDFAFVLHRRHPARRRPLTLERFTAIPQLAIAPEGRAENPLDERLAQLGTRRRVVAQVPSFLAVPPLVAQGQLGATLPRRLIEPAATRWGLAVLELPFEMPSFDLSQGWHERLRHDPAHAWFRQLVVATLRGEG